MAKKLIKKLVTEDDVDRWLQKADLTEYFTGDEFERVRFSKLEQKLVNESYERALESQPVTLRLPKGLIQKLKLAAMKKGIAYQTLASLVLRNQVNQLLK